MKRDIRIEASLFFAWGLLNFVQGLITVNPLLTAELNEIVVGVTRIAIGVIIFGYVAYLTAVYIGDQYEKE